MRKADYALLAGVINHRVLHHKREALCSVSTLDEKRAQKAYVAETELDIIARAFASNASVNRVEFLKACGIET